MAEMDVALSLQSTLVLKISTWAGLAIGLVALLYLASLVGSSAYRRWHLASLPHAPGSVPLLRQLPWIAFHPSPWNLLAGWLESTSHNIMTWGIPCTDFVMVRGGEAMKTVFQTRFRDWHKDVSLSFHPYLCLLGTGLVTSEGELWQKQRKLMTPAFKGDILQEVIRIGLRAVQRLVDKLKDYESSESVVDIEEDFRLLTLQVITEAVLSLPHEESDRVFPALYLPIMEECGKRVLHRWREYMPFMPSWWRHRSLRAKLDSYLLQKLRERWNTICKTCKIQDSEPVPKDMLDVILLGKRRGGESWSTELETQLCYELKTFLLAGHETSASMLTLTLLEVMCDPEMEAKVLKEATAVLGAPGQSKVPTKEEVEAGMPYTFACLQETLRKYSIVPVSVRTATRDTKLLGKFIPKGTKCSLMMGLTHDQWAEPDQYRPQRFLPGGELETFPEDVRRFMFVPFGQGPRVCIGQHFSLMEARVVLGKLLQCYKCTLQRPRKLEWRPYLIPNQPVGGVPISVQRRI